MSTVYPIAEEFVSPQGEGFWNGALMHFVRFAGCNVGKPYTTAERENNRALQVLPQYMEKCQTQMGTVFSCDTQYTMSKKMTAEEIASLCEYDLRVCLTGGEPLLHDLFPLIALLHKNHTAVHIETSGTKPLYDLRLSTGDRQNKVWIAVSPKIGCLPDSLGIADEIKILVGSDFDEARFMEMYRYFDKLWLQPINHEHTIDMVNMKKCLELQTRYPQCRISSQAHKSWEVR